MMILDIVVAHLCFGSAAAPPQNMSLENRRMSSGLESTSPQSS